jgi:hypothetical protein
MPRSRPVASGLGDACICCNDSLVRQTAGVPFFSSPRSPSTRRPEDDSP